MGTTHTLRVCCQCYKSRQQEHHDRMPADGSSGFVLPGLHRQGPNFTQSALPAFYFPIPFTDFDFPPMSSLVAGE